MPKRLRQAAVLLPILATLASSCAPLPFVNGEWSGGLGTPAAPVVRPERPACPPLPVSFRFNFAEATSEDDRALIKQSMLAARDRYPLRFKRSPVYSESANRYSCQPKKATHRISTTVTEAGLGEAGLYTNGDIRLYMDPDYWTTAPRDFKYRLTLHEAYHLYQDLAVQTYGHTTSRMNLLWMVEGSAMWAEYDAAVAMGAFPSMDAARAQEDSYNNLNPSDLPDFERYQNERDFDAYSLFFEAVDFLLEHHGGPKALRRYWQYAGENDDWWVVFQKAFGIKAHAFYEEFAAS